MIKYFRFDYNYVLWGISYANLMMLSATIPVYESTSDKDNKPAAKKQVKGKDYEDTSEDLTAWLGIK